MLYHKKKEILSPYRLLSIITFIINTLFFLRAGFGEIIGALGFIALSIKFRAQGSCSREVLFYSYLMQVCCFVALFFNLPADASLRETGEKAIIHTRYNRGNRAAQQ